MSKPTNYKLISLDTSSKHTGYAVYVGGKLISYGDIDHEKEKDSEKRVFLMSTDIIKFLMKEKPSTICIEITAVERNARTQRMLSEIVGVVKGYAYINDCEIVGYRPSTWKRFNCDPQESAPIKRDISKAWSMEKVKHIYNIDVKNNDNISDAILIGRARFIEAETLCDDLLNDEIA